MGIRKNIELKNTIDEQILAIKSYVDGFEVILPKDEQALQEFSQALNMVTQCIKDLDEARIKRKHLMGELSRACSELEESGRRFTETVKDGA